MCKEKIKALKLENKRLKAKINTVLFYYKEVHAELARNGLTFVPKGRKKKEKSS